MTEFEAGSRSGQANSTVPSRPESFRFSTVVRAMRGMRARRVAEPVLAQSARLHTEDSSESQGAAAGGGDESKAQTTAMLREYMPVFQGGGRR